MQKFFVVCPGVRNIAITFFLLKNCFYISIHIIGMFIFYQVVKNINGLLFSSCLLYNINNIVLFLNFL